MRYELRDLTREQLDKSSKMILMFKHFMYRKLEPNKYETFCPTCRRKHIVTYKELRKVQSDHYCPDCGAWIHHTTREVKGRKTDYVAIDNLGYCLDIEYDFDDVKVISYEQFADFNCYTRISFAVRKGYYLKSSGCIYRNPWEISDTFKYAYNHKFERYCYSYDSNLFTMLNGSPTERKKIYSKECSFISKSNQMKMIIDNRLTHKQASLIKVFDLNRIEDVDKYKYLLNDYGFYSHLDDFIKSNRLLNVYYLDYLARTGIDLGKYYHYMNNLILLGWKLDKPKTKDDFEYRLNKTDELIQAEKDKLLNERIDERYPQLPKYQYENITISPFKSAHDVRRCGKVLHNCIGGYIERYSKGETDLYELKVDDILTVAIEMRGKTLRQARADHNEPCPDELMEHINKFILAM